ncbi:AAA family ATPase [Silvanigrella aquatica]|uniref:AAA family ATPase n=1 Tax=Silvanigrella aquatica TaxID=1915309 RepID=UPI000ACF30D3|nr:AAA family ATPase [Silvanigrella aquatica]
MLISESTIKKIKDTVDCRSLVKSLGINLNNSSNISCSEINPNHEDKNPSMAVYHDHVLCFSCGFNADAIKIIQNLKSKSFTESVEYICHNYNIKVEFENIKKHTYDNKNSDILEKIWNISKDVEVTNSFMNWMKKRNIDIRSAYQSGCRDIYPIRSKICELIKSCPENDLKNSGLMNDKNELWKPFTEIIRGNKAYYGFIIPIFNSENKIVNMRYRLYENIIIKKTNKEGKIVEKTIKVYAQPRANNHIIGFNQLNSTKKSLYICEGEPDYLSLKTYFNRNNIEDSDVLGFCVLTKDWKDEFNNEIRKYDNIKICLHDNHKAIAISNIIQKSLISYCEKKEEKEHWKNNFYECFFPENNDINDHLVKNALNNETFNFILKKFDTSQENVIDTSNKSSNFNFLPLNILEICSNKPPQLEFIFPGLLRGIVGSVVASGGTGKTMWALQTCSSIACGNDMLKYGQLNTGKSVLLSGEDPEQITALRLHSMCKYLSEKEIHELNKNMFIYSISGKNPNIMDKNWFEWIKNVTINSKLVIIDTLRVFHNLEENDSGKMSELIKIMGSIASENNTSILFLHHTNKNSANNSNGGDQQASRGSSVLTDNIKLQINLVTMTSPEAKDLGIDEQDRKLYVKYVYSKMNYGSPIADRWLKREDGGILKPTDLTKKESNNLSQIFGGRKGGI